MPIFEYKCNECDNTFEELVTGPDKKISCPKCNSEKIGKLLSIFSATVNSSGGAPSCGAPSCGSGFS